MANMNTWYTPGYGNNGTLFANGVLTGVPMSNQFYPSMASAPFYKGSGQGPPTVPINYLGSMGASGQSAVQTAIDNPWDPRQSPLIPALAALVVGLLGLHLVHWRH